LAFNFELFIAKRIISAKQNKSSISAPIIKIAIAAISLGLVVMMISVATGVGLQHKIREKLAGFNGHIQITSFQNTTEEITDRPLSVNQDFYPDFKEVSGIEHMQVYATKFGLFRTDESFQGIVFKGIDSAYDWQFFQEYLQRGVLPDLGDELTQEVLISKIVADAMRLDLGDKISTFFIKADVNKLPNRRIFEVVGIYDTGYKEFDENLVFGDIRHIQRLNRWGPSEVGGFEVLLEDFDAIQSKGVEIYESLPPEMTSSTIYEDFPEIFDWLALFDNNIILILVIMVMIAGINMITALLVLILERAQMIGILKAMGAADKSIAKIFLYNAAYLILIGLFWGNLIGLGFLGAQEYFGFISLDSETYYVTKAPVYFSWTAFALLNIGTLLMCLIMLLIPTLIISKIEPSKVIKFE
jgi:lipoprotein-releasing system permease protein